MPSSPRLAGLENNVVYIIIINRNILCLCGGCVAVCAEFLKFVINNIIYNTIV